ncbi:hypothetical protein GXW74_20695 [Roseomonas eburnea]|uniref:Periplasmic heavy metal sensor n=1 Tax=Neoroseomonas eburnea TaxID=1346889 RepID=A0A9X9XGT7_9PROT|nr:hypothetical protein [Neoroseomonas eburnea]MBR0682923.1 hypothetical protein [Neoroseomonas eburnea]
MRVLISTFALLAVTTAAFAQHGGDHARGAQVMPNAEPGSRDIKALSREQVADLRAARGMGLALAAERNGYPGPMHALEHAEALRLTTLQTIELQLVMDGMRRNAIAAGERVIEAERILDRLFSERRATPDAVAEATARIGVESASLRAVHLAAHIATRAVLTSDQIVRYDEVRGYRRAD